MLAKLATLMLTFSRASCSTAELTENLLFPLISRMPCSLISRMPGREGGLEEPPAEEGRETPMLPVDSGRVGKKLSTDDGRGSEDEDKSIGDDTEDKSNGEHKDDRSIG